MISFRLPARALRLWVVLPAMLASLAAADSALSSLVEKFTAKKAAQGTPVAAPKPIAQPIDQPLAVPVKVAPETTKPGGRKHSPSLASLPAPKASGPLRILLIDDDASSNNAGGDTGTAQRTDEIFRELVAKAVGGKADAWSSEVVKVRENGPAFERLRGFNVVIWYTGAAYGANNDTIGREDEKTLRRYLEETGGAVIIVSPGYVNNLVYGQSWEAAEHPFLKEVLAVNGCYGLVQRAARGTVRAYNGTEFQVEHPGVSPEAQFSVVNPDGAAIVFTSPLSTSYAKQEGGLPVAVASGYGQGRIVYVGFTFENIPEKDRAAAFATLLGAAQGAAPAVPSPTRTPVAIVPKAPILAPANVAANGSATVTDPPRAFAVIGSGRDVFNFHSSGAGAIRVRVQSKGVPIIVAALHPDGRKVEQGGTGDFTLATQMSNDDAKGHIWGVTVRAATPTEDTKVVASGTVIVSHPPADAAAVQSQLATIASRTQILRTAQPVQTLSLSPATLAGIRAAELKSATVASAEPAPLSAAPDRLALTSIVGATTTAPAAQPPAPPPHAPPLLRPLDPSSGGAGTLVTLWGRDLFPPDTPAERVMTGWGGPDYFRAELHFLAGPDRIIAPLQAGERRATIHQPLETETDTTLYKFVGGDYAPKWQVFERWYFGKVPELPVPGGTVVSAYFVSKDGRKSNAVTFTYGTAAPPPPSGEQFLYLPIVNGKLVDSTLSSNYPNADLSKGWIRRDTFLLGFVGEDTFYNTMELQNGWKVVDAVVNIEHQMLGGAKLIESMPGTNRPFVKVRWDLEPTLLMSNDISYTLRIRIRGPAHLAPY